jgi:hypothetical protein
VVGNGSPATKGKGALQHSFRPSKSIIGPKKKLGIRGCVGCCYLLVRRCTFRFVRSALRAINPALHAGMRFCRASRSFRPQ